MSGFVRVITDRVIPMCLSGSPIEVITEILSWSEATINGVRALFSPDEGYRWVSPCRPNIDVRPIHIRPLLEYELFKLTKYDTYASELESVSGQLTLKVIDKILRQTPLGDMEAFRVIRVDRAPDETRYVDGKLVFEESKLWVTTVGTSDYVFRITGPDHPKSRAGGSLLVMVDKGNRVFRSLFGLPPSGATTFTSHPDENIRYHSVLFDDVLKFEMLFHIDEGHPVFTPIDEVYTLIKPCKDILTRLCFSQNVTPAELMSGHP